MRKHISSLKRYAIEIGGLIVLTLIIFLVSISPRGEHTTQQFFDQIRTTGSRSEAVILGIDDESLQEIGAWPFDRKVFADLTKVLNGYGAKLIVYDVLFLESRQGDLFFKDALSQTTVPVILASKIENGKYLGSFLAEPSNSNIFSALSNVNPDVDGKVRKYPLFSIQNGKCIPGLGEQAFRIITFKTGDQCVERDSYFRYPENISLYSLVDVLKGKVLEEKIKGKTVFIGSASLDLEDHFVGLTGEKIPGVEVHASIFTSLLNKEGDSVLTPLEIMTAILVCIGIALFILYYMKSVLGQLVGMIIFLALLFVSSYVFFLYHSILPLPWLLLTVLITGGYITLIRFVGERKRSEYVQTLFSKYVHKDVLKELMKSSASLHFEGEKKEVTVLFSDLRGFTTLSESLSPEELTRVLNGYFSAMTPPILEEMGTIDKFIGDAIMAFWNAPLPVASHSTRALRAALRMQTELDTFNEKYTTTLKMGVGLHRGDVIVGNVGSQDRVNYTILGDTVNLGSRVEGLTKKYGVVCIATEAVKNAVDDDSVLFRKLDVITVKGKAEHTLLYEAKWRTKEDEIVCERYEEGFEYYYNGDFTQAKKIFDELVEKGDGPSATILERITSIGTKPENWDGVWHFDEK